MIKQLERRGRHNTRLLKAKAGVRLAAVALLVAGVLVAASGAAQADTIDVALGNAGSGLRADVM